MTLLVLVVQTHGGAAKDHLLSFSDQGLLMLLRNLKFISFECFNPKFFLSKCGVFREWAQRERENH